MKEHASRPGRTGLAVLALLVAAATASLAWEPPARRAEPFLRGVVLSLHDEDPERDYSPEVAEIDSRLGASTVSVAFHFWQERADSPAPGRAERTPTDDALRRLYRAIRARGLAALAFPIVLIEKPGPDDWRGKLRPPDPDAWFSAYEAEVVRQARLAAEEGVQVFSVGSELGWSHSRGERWRGLVAAVRRVFPGRLVYGANWDEYASFPAWDALDYVGLSGYHELASEPGTPVEALTRSWNRIRDDLLAWKGRAAPGKPLLFTELGYPSQTGSAAHPWNYGASDRPDPEEQRRGFEAFFASWSGTRELQGVFVYEWWGEGGPDDTQYTPRGKPAERTIRSFFGDVRVVESRRRP